MSFIFEKKLTDWNFEKTRCSIWINFQFLVSELCAYFLSAAFLSAGFAGAAFPPFPAGAAGAAGAAAAAAGFLDFGGLNKIKIQINKLS